MMDFFSERFCVKAITFCCASKVENHQRLFFSKHGERILPYFMGKPKTMFSKTSSVKLLRGMRKNLLNIASGRIGGINRDTLHQH
jgi:hypothetical protein